MQVGFALPCLFPPPANVRRMLEASQPFVVRSNVSGLFALRLMSLPLARRSAIGADWAKARLGPVPRDNVRSQAKLLRMPWDASQAPLHFNQDKARGETDDGKGR